MNNSHEARRMINNELKTRGFNKQVKRTLKDHTPAEEQDDLHIDFYCECSDENCNERIAMTFEEYEKLHQQGDKFVIAKGHQSPTVEKITTANPDHLVVEKFDLKP